MSKLPENNKMQATLENQHRKTMKAVNAIKHDTEVLIQKSDYITEQLSEEIVDLETALLTKPKFDQDAEEPVIGNEATTATETSDRDKLIAEISNICVPKVMATINPVLNALQQFIKENSIEMGQTAEVDDEAFAEKLIEEMKVSLGRRQKIALARKRLTPHN
ncbi:MAG: hypothetical protein V3V13_01315 [Paracoccaceae bacterium]